MGPDVEITDDTEAFTEELSAPANDGGVLVRISTEVVAERGEEKAQSLFDGRRATTCAVVEGSHFEHELFPSCRCHIVACSTPKPGEPLPRKIHKPIENFEVVAGSEEEGGAMPGQGGFESS